MKSQCPYCSQKVSIASRMKYCFIGTDFSIRCPHCGNKIRPLKTSLSFQQSFYAGALTAFLSFWGYIYLIEDRFWSAILFAVCMSALIIIAIGIFTIKDIEFTKER